MQLASTPDNEEQRRTSVARMNIIATPREADFDRITRIAKIHFNVETCIITTADKDTIWTHANAGTPAPNIPRDISMCGHTLISEDYFIIPDTLKDPRFSDNPLVLGPQKIRFYAGVPIKNVEGFSAGTFCMFDTNPRELSTNEVNVLQDFAKLAEMAYRARNLGQSQSELLVELDVAKRNALIDPLTKIWNRGGLDRLLNAELAIAAKANEPIAVVMVDLDKFKTINDSFGHSKGDNAIRLAADLLKSAVRSTDIVARYGGEEFTIVMRGLPSAQLSKVTCKVLSLFREKAVLNMEDGSSHAFTASVGAAFVDNVEQNIKPDILLKAADDAVYQAKKRGRNCCETTILHI